MEVAAITFRYRKPKNNNELIDILENRRHYLGLDRFDPEVLDVMRRTDRALFAPPGERNIYEDEPFKIGQGQTCSQPSMVAAMATMLKLEPGMKVLEIGTGCGYSASVTAQLIQPGGRLFTIEIIGELTELARKNIGNLEHIDNIKFITGDGSIGLPGEAPFDRIYLTAGVGRYFKESILLAQLRQNGILLYPEAHGAMFYVKNTPGEPERQSMGGVGFVFLRGKNAGF